MEQNKLGNTNTYVATCLFGLEKFVGEEIDACGGNRLETIDGRVVFTGNDDVLARANLNLRTEMYALSDFLIMVFVMVSEAVT